MEDVASELAFGNGLDEICGKLRGQEGFEFELLHFALQLLGALIRLLFQDFNLALHAGDSFFALRNFQLQFFFCIVLRFVTNCAERLLNAGFDGQVELALLVVELALLANRLRLGILRFGEFLVLRFDNGLKICKFSRLTFEFV